MFKFLDFYIGCTKSVAFWVAIFLLYLKITHQITVLYPLELVAFIRTTLQIFAQFLQGFYQYLILIPAEALIYAISIPLKLIGISIPLSLPDWYPSAAYLSTMLYITQRAAQRLAIPTMSYSDPARPKEREGEWQNAVLALLWNLILVLYIPINRLSLWLKSYVSRFENFSATFLANFLKTFLGGSVFLGYLFLVHDVLVVAIRPENDPVRFRKHLAFLGACALALVISTAMAILTIWLSIKRPT